MSSIVSDDPADLFAELYDRLDEPIFDTMRVFDWMDYRWLRDIAQEVEEQVVLTGRVDPDRVQELLDLADEDEMQERLFAILLGLDRALAYANPFLGTRDQAGLLSLAARYTRTGRLSTSAISGVVLPRCTFLTPTEGFRNRLGDVFTSVVRVPGEALEYVDFQVLPARNDCGQGPLEAFNVGCVAMLATADELTWNTNVQGDHSLYRIAVKDTPPYRERVARVLRLMDESGVTLGLIPELALNNSLLEYWVDLVMSAPPPPMSRLKWILVGTGAVTDHDPPFNEGVVIDRITGEVVLSQPKLHRFTLNREQLEKWNLEPLLGNDPITEGIATGKHIIVVESTLGRVAVLVCEDLAHIMDLGPPLRSCGVSHILSPVFSKQTRLHYWEHAKAKEHAHETGSVVFVANSLVVPHLMGEAGRIGCFLLHSPDYTRLGVAEAPDEVIVLTAGTVSNSG